MEASMAEAPIVISSTGSSPEPLPWDYTGRQVPNPNHFKGGRDPLLTLDMDD